MNGWVTIEPSAGEIGDGAGGAATAARPVTLKYKTVINKSVRDRQIDVRGFITFLPK